MSDRGTPSPQGLTGGDVAVRTRGLTKLYGSSVGIIDVDLDVERGEVFGLLGPNGAGKTTLIRTLLDLIRPTRGTATVLGLDARRQGIEARGRVGYLPGEFSLWPSLDARRTLAFTGRLRDDIVEARAHRLAERLHLDLEMPVGRMSKGNKQKVGLLLALAPLADLYVLDEPTGGLDPLIQAQFRGIVAEEVERGATILLSSHVMHEVEHLAHRVGVVNQGRLVMVERVDALRRKAARPVSVTFAEAAPVGALTRLADVRIVHTDGRTADLRVTGSMDGLIKELARFEVVALDAPEADLEDVFLDLYREEDAR
jgi:ABC-2 type transport system ATP-binding protein